MRLFALLSFVLMQAAFAEPLSCQFRSDSDRALGERVLEMMDRPLEGEERLGACPGKQIHLTFDDGPMGRVTNPILAALRSRQTRATFFVSTHNLSNQTNRDIVSQTMADGHLIASHGHDHDNYDLRIRQGRAEAGMDHETRVAQINQSVRLLDQATGGRFSRQQHRLFRFPYGRGAMPSRAELAEIEREAGISSPTNCNNACWSERMAAYRERSPALQAIAAAGFSHLGWSIDSGDSAASAPQANSAGGYNTDDVARYVRQNLAHMCASGGDVAVALFHDIKPFNIQAIPVLMDIAACMRMRFVDANTMMQSQSLVNRGTLIPRTRIQQGPARTVERGLAAVLGGGQAPTCVNCDPQPEDYSCYSQSLGHRIPECSGYSSICVRGEMESAGDPRVREFCPNGTRPPTSSGAGAARPRAQAQPSCVSESLGRSVAHCTGFSSVCVSGNWRTRAQAESSNACPNGIGSP